MSESIDADPGDGDTRASNPTRSYARTRARACEAPGQFERRLIAQRTEEALAAKKAAGIRLGRPPTVPQSVVRRIQRQRARSDSFRAIAADLNQAKVPTAQGGKQWYAATVRHVVIRTS